MPDRAGRAARLLPRGTLAVGAGLMGLGAGMYVHLAVAGHSLPATGMAAVSVLWSLVFLLGSGTVAAALAIVLIRHAPRQELAEALLNAVTSLPGP
jgi:hypothetical protein